MRYIVIASAIVLSGCAMTPAELAKTDVDRTLVSKEAPRKVATCAVEAMMGGSQNVLRNEGDHYWILRNNTYGVPVTRWDFFPTPDGGSRIELRSSLGMNDGYERVRFCI